MKILFLSYYFNPDLSAGSFRNTSLFNELQSRLGENDFVHVISTVPNRYKSFSIESKDTEQGSNYRINRISVPQHKSGFVDQIFSFKHYYDNVQRLVKDQDYDIVYASSSRLFTAFLGQRLATKKKAKLYLDIRDIFVDTIKDVLKNRALFEYTLIPVLKFIEKQTFSKADHINLVSGGFQEYFSKYSKPSYTYFTNGIDDIFEKEIQTNTEAVSFLKENKGSFTITYAGNIGEGQGLEKIIPQLAQELGPKYQIKIIGDGGAKKLLKDAVKSSDVSNVEFIDPVNRDELIFFYKNADFLLLHLNDYDAFKKVIPSKVFEYAVFNKPILAGVSGFSAKFIKEEISNSCVFVPGDYTTASDYIKNYSWDSAQMDRTIFIQKYLRKSIMKRMVESILDLIR